MQPALALLVLGHGLDPSLLELREREGGTVEVLWRAAADTAAEVSPRLPARCVRRTEVLRSSDGLGERQHYSVDCGAAGLSGETVAIDGLEHRAGLEVLLRLERPDSQSVLRVLDAARPAVTVPATRSRVATLRDYLGLGITHILGGADHLLFVLGMVMLVRARRKLLAAITAFTAAHSLTLALASLGVVHFPALAGEVVIALSIVFLAAELSRPDGAEPTATQRWPWAMAFGFGLIHGIGFAGALGEIGLPAADVPLALLGFNLGVEVGQVGVVLAALGVGLAVRRAAPRLARTAPRPLAYVIGTVAAVWFFERCAVLLSFNGA